MEVCLFPGTNLGDLHYHLIPLLKEKLDNFIMHIASLPTRMNMASIPIIKKDTRSYQKTIPSLQEGIYLTRIIRLDQKNANLSLKT